MAAANTREPPFWGQLFMVGIPGPRMDAVARELVRDLQVGGIILFARNLESPEQVWELTRELQRVSLEASGRLLLIAVDQEGGTVQRLRTPFTLIPPARELGAGGDARAVEQLARQVGRELALVGLNMNLAPVLDVARDPRCPQWDRSYGSDPSRVAALGLAAIRGYLAGGVLPVAKHFPGLGDTQTDSHQELPLAQSGDPERQTDLWPFRQAVAARVPAIMTAHLLVPAWEPRPATLSSVALQHWLRGNLAFPGVIITDDLEMGAIAAHLPVTQGARDALAAGADLLLVCKNWESLPDAVRLLARDPDLASRGLEAAGCLEELRQRLQPNPAGPGEVRQYFQQRHGTG